MKILKVVSSLVICAGLISGCGKGTAAFPKTDPTKNPTPSNEISTMPDSDLVLTPRGSEQQLNMVEFTHQATGQVSRFFRFKPTVSGRLNIGWFQVLPQSCRASVAFTLNETERQAVQLMSLEAQVAVTAGTSYLVQATLINEESRCPKGTLNFSVIFEEDEGPQPSPNPEPQPAPQPEPQPAPQPEPEPLPPLPPVEPQPAPQPAPQPEPQPVPAPQPPQPAPSEGPLTNLGHASCNTDFPEPSVLDIEYQYSGLTLSTGRSYRTIYGQDVFCGVADPSPQYPAQCTYSITGTGTAQNPGDVRLDVTCTKNVGGRILHISTGELRVNYQTGFGRFRCNLRNNPNPLWDIPLTDCAIEQQ